MPFAVRVLMFAPAFKYLAFANGHVPKHKCREEHISDVEH